MREANAGAELSPVRPVRGFGPGGRLPGRGPDMFGPTRIGSSRAYEYVKVHSIYTCLSMLSCPPPVSYKNQLWLQLFCLSHEFVKYTG